MQIIDINGKVITITDLDSDIDFAEKFLSYHNETHHLLQAEMHAYWQHIYRELMALKAEQRQQRENDLNERL